MSTKPNRNYFNLSLKEGSAERKEKGWKECEREGEREGRREGAGKQLSVPADVEETDLTRLCLNSPYSYLSTSAAW